jgi:hypothetical protein
MQAAGVTCPALLSPPSPPHSPPKRRLTSPNQPPNYPSAPGSPAQLPAHSDLGDAGASGPNVRFVWRKLAVSKQRSLHVCSRETVWVSPGRSQGGEGGEGGEGRARTPSATAENRPSYKRRRESNATSPSKKARTASQRKAAEQERDGGREFVIPVAAQSGWDGTGLDVWSLALDCLCRTLDRLRDSLAIGAFSHSQLRDQTPPTKGGAVLELGAGTGVAGMFCAKYLCSGPVYLTDNDSNVLTLLRKNVLENGYSHLSPFL